MTDETKNALPPVVNQPRRPPVRVKLRRVRANFAKVYPPDGESKAWWKRLKKALGTASSDFVNASLLQLQEASQLPFSGISEVAMNAALALIEAAAPTNEIEGALTVQMACTHAAAMSILARFRGGGGSEHRVVALATAAARLMRAYSVQVETLRRLRHGGDQYVRVEHVHVNDGGQAVIGNVKTAGPGNAARGPGLTPSANAQPYAISGSSTSTSTMVGGHNRKCEDGGPGAAGSPEHSAGGVIAPADQDR